MPKWRLSRHLGVPQQQPRSKARIGFLALRAIAFPHSAIWHVPRKHGAEEHGADERGVGDDKERGNEEYESRQ